MAAKDGDAARPKLVGEVADLWFHSMVALAHFGLKPADVMAELERREGISGIEENALPQGAQSGGQGIMNETIELSQQERSLKTVGHISYLLHTIVAVGAVLPGVQAACCCC